MLQEELKAAAIQRAKSVLGLDQYPMLPALEERVNSIVADFTAGAEWQESKNPTEAISLDLEKDNLHEILGISAERFLMMQMQFREAMLEAQVLPDTAALDMIAPCAKIPANMKEAFLVGYMIALPIQMVLEKLKANQPESPLILPHGYKKR